MFINRFATIAIAALAALATQAAALPTSFSRSARSSMAATTPITSKSLEDRQVTSRLVFAHYMFGLTSGQTLAEWQTDIAQAQSAGIDGFALNAGSADAWNPTQLPLAFEAADAAGFRLFISFDMAASSWSVEQVVSYVDEYKGRSSYYKVGGLPFVSTFEGPDWVDNWAAVRSATGGIYLVPDWASIGPGGVAGQLSKTDGACK